MAFNKPYTDVIFQSVKLYVEGIQIPFSSISITSGYGGLPSANISVPAQAGLMDIARFYSPKVHIFYEDRFGDYDEDDPDDLKRKDRLLFSGIITQVAYVKSKNTGANMIIQFQCQHRYTLINELLLDYTGWLNADSVDPQSVAGGIKADTSGSVWSVIDALAGITKKNNTSLPKEKQEITKDNPFGSPTVIPKRYEGLFDRIQGMPSVMFNFWNQMKRSAFKRVQDQGDRYYSEAFIKIYQPLVEDGLRFFDRIAGHKPIEELVNDDMYRADPCPETPNRKEKILIPPVNQMFLASSVQSEMAISNIASRLQSSGEVTTIYGVFSQFYDSIDYDLLTLTSPAMAPTTEGEEPVAVDTIVKPRIPFYLSPTCNVLFPGMYHHVSVNYDEFNIPTRIDARNLEGPGGDRFKTHFRAPHSIREAIAKKVAGVNGVGGTLVGKPYSLLSTTGPSYGAIGIYEQGRGIKQENMHLPRWLSWYSQSLSGEGVAKDKMPDANTEPGKVKALKELAEGWAKRYPGDANKPLNPYEVENSDVLAHHRILFTAADYYYTQAFARSKNGSAECLFNPFIVPGYPMDILEKNPLFPSFHAFCTQVTHTISADQCSTSVQFTSAMTYSELANYYIPFTSPIIQVALDLASNPTLMGIEPDDVAFDTAEEFYRYTLGVSCVTPEMLLDFASMELQPLQWKDDMSGWEEGSGDSIPAPNGGEMNPMLSFEGNLSMVYRDIENRKNIETDFDIVFVDMTAGNYGPTTIRYEDPELEDQEKLEIGQSQFLTYDEYFGQTIDQPTSTSGVSSVADTPASDTNSATDPNEGNVQDLGLGT